ncbi:uncharacterized protein AMSG_01445 [Thecamonas trahens ATCC 50062]|uniref:PH domain-containing protein n=1 Tax=Thecamonas trahens ATCC 50062 TaxID=461836 RepID=A0A0L0DQM0_THETB|nr:hypothetical protein AMSG_01445 [Thecamonas trahens ATCC 50062]KNC54589.1 hypothetical protein AMSG_01445 [Thecamonas trahens ATCC 50062]|eukprot:XP_013761498.1 hypothetical protein AMSG_01445 [Thecamonas trahens ATCC 50062]
MADNPPRAVVLDDFDAEADDEVSVTAGATVVVLETYDDGWAKVRVVSKGIEGMMPIIYLEYTNKALAPMPTRTAPAPSPAPSPSSSPTSSFAKLPAYGTSTAGSASTPAWIPPRGVSANRSSGRSSASSASGSGSSSSRFTMSGWLDIEASPGKWKRKWYVVEGNKLTACRNPSSLKKRATVVEFGVGSAVRLLHHKQDTTAPPVLEITTRGATKLYLRTANSDEAELWLSGIETAIYGVGRLN